MKSFPLLLPVLLAGLALPLSAGEMRPAAQVMTAQELDEFATYYYQQPRPDLIPAAIEALGPSGFLDATATATRPGGRFWVLVGFFAEVFAANPDRVEEWRRLGTKDWATRDCLRAAAKFGRPGALLAVEGAWILRPAAVFSLGNSWGAANDARWGAFFASGNPAYVRRFVAQLPDVVALNADGTGIDAMWSLARNLPAHPQVRATLEESRATADPSTRALLDDLLTKDTETVRRNLVARIPRYAVTGGGPGYLGLRNMGYFGPVSPRSELHPENSGVR